MNGLSTVTRERGAGEELAGPRRLADFEIPHSQPPRPIRVPAYLKPEFRRVVREGLKMPLDQSGWRVSPKCTRWTRFWAPGGDDQLARSPERRLVEAPELARMQRVVGALQEAYCRDADLQMLGDRALVEGVGGAGQLDLAMQRLVGHA